MEIRQLKYFVRIVELGSLTRAAESLYIAQPALSQQMSSLEKDLGVKLLSRSVRGVSVTQAGEAFYRQANTILKQVENARLIVSSEHDHPSGMVSIGIPSSIANVLAVPLFSAVRKKYPDILLEINETPSAFLDELVINGRIDIGLLFNFSRTKGLKLRKLIAESLYPLIRKRPIFTLDRRGVIERRLKAGADQPVADPLRAGQTFINFLIFTRDKQRVAAIVFNLREPVRLYRVVMQRNKQAVFCGQRGTFGQNLDLAVRTDQAITDVPPSKVSGDCFREPPVQFPLGHAAGADRAGAASRMTDVERDLGGGARKAQASQQ